MSFQFVNNGDIDRKARKLIRSHAARGKNVGKSRPRRKPPEQVARMPVPSWTPRALETVEDRSSRSRGADETIPTIERQLGDGLSVLSLPIELTAVSKAHLKNAISFLSKPLYPDVISHLIDFSGAGDNMMNFLFLDDAFLHCIIATFVAENNRRLAKQEDVVESLYHLSCTFRLVNEKLSGNRATADTTIAAVLAMIRYERLQGRNAQGLIHFKGLLRLVELRGGIAHLQELRPRLAQKVFRADFEFALHLGSTLKFGTEELPGHHTVAWLRNKVMKESTPIFCHSPLCGQLSMELRNAMIDITGLASWLGNDCIPKGGAKVDCYTYHDALILLGYHLIYISPLAGPRPTCPLENVIHWGLISFLTSFMVGIASRTPTYNLLPDLARSSLLEIFDGDDLKQEALLWGLFISGITILSPKDDLWLLPRIAEIIAALSVRSWEDTSQMLSKFPWLNALHEKGGKALWQRAMSYHDTLSELQGDASRSRAISTQIRLYN